MSDHHSSYDEPAGRSSAVAVVLAAVFLTLLGAMVGVIIGTTQKNGGTNVANQSPGPTGPSPAVTVTETAPSGNNGGGGGTRAPNPGKTYPPTTKDDCPKQTDEKAGINLTRVLYVRTDHSEAWICEGGGDVYYQGHTLDKPFPAATSQTSIFLSGVHYEAGVYSADNAGTRYLVSREELVIVHSDGRRETQAVQESSPSS
jgi:hypothetical protein